MEICNKYPAEIHTAPGNGGGGGGGGGTGIQAHGEKIRIDPCLLVGWLYWGLTPL